ncbi:hypothetical protein [Actinophytocola sp.]|uniref:hypothetical protein n=1 Tax=Actinophytocola sp. TaxID=1872138 RepID=UPI002D2F1C1A|nr:hypothetical protein [Actinophytocola sp.]HYQ69046.1 hypothetical protein [Actinophytocola sp.]
MKAVRELAELVHAVRDEHSNGGDIAQAASELVDLLMGPQTNCPVSAPDCRTPRDGEHDACTLPDIRLERLTCLPAPDVVDRENVAYWGDVDSGGFVSASAARDADDFLTGVDMGWLFATTRMVERRAEQVALMLLAAARHATPPRQPRRTPGGFLFRQIPHPLCGESEERERAGLPGHCEDCCAVGHVLAHLDLDCDAVGCYSDHDAVPVEPDPSTVDYRVCRVPVGYVDRTPCRSRIDDVGRCVHGHYPAPEHIRYVLKASAQ